MEIKYGVNTLAWTVPLTIEGVKELFPKMKAEALT